MAFMSGVCSVSESDGIDAGQMYELVCMKANEHEEYFFLINERGRAVRNFVNSPGSYAARFQKALESLPQRNFVGLAH